MLLAPPADVPDAPVAGVRLAPVPDPGPVPVAGSGGAAVPPGGRAAIPINEIVLAAAGLALAVLEARRRDRAAGLPPPVDVVFVPGHGSTASGTFDALIARLGLHDDQVHRFDYRWATGHADHVAASESASVDDAADALGGYLRGLAGGERPVYLVGFSKGGAVLAELIARWDAAPEHAVPGVVGAALLDPPIAAGLLGDLQSAGTLVGPIPDDGGYDPVECRFLGVLDCHDRRDDLGVASGVRVQVVRSPDAEVTNFLDSPPGLRVLDLEGVPGGGRGWLPDAAYSIAAHLGVPDALRTADCLADEMWLPGSCSPAPTGPGPETRPWWRRAIGWLLDPVGHVLPNAWNPLRDPRPSIPAVVEKVPLVSALGKAVRALFH
jgi:hypothetical protein